ncbi:MAG: hypothetical protein K2J39_08385 [Ruminococcus sp.]|nr:hypothetical protein [Ruminococcus sp.]
MIHSYGQDVRRIKNKCFAKFQTPYTENIALAFGRSNIPYFARFSDSEISIVYDADFVVSASEIITKSQSRDYSEITNKNHDLLPEIAKILNIAPGTLKNYPDDIQSALRQFYIDFWFCDTPTIRRGLEKFLMADEEN